MNETSKMDPLKTRVYHEFEAASKFAGAAFMRQSMSFRLCMLEQIYHETEIGREFTDDEQLERYTNWNSGLNSQTINDRYCTCRTRQKAEEHKSEAG